MLYVVFGILLLALLYFLIRGHAEAIRYNKGTPALVIGASRRDIWPYYILRVIRFLLVIFFFVYLYRYNSKNIENTEHTGSGNTLNGNVNKKGQDFSTQAQVIKDERCLEEMHWENTGCMPNVREIGIENGKGEEHWLGDRWSAGIIVSCDVGYTIFAGKCIDIDILPNELKEKISNTPTPNLPKDCDWGKVERVVDGDTIVVKGRKVRLIGIDTPESVDPDKSIEPYALEAKNRITMLVENQEVCLSLDTYSDNVDKYDRLLRYVYLHNGTFINSELIRTGYAKVYTSFPFNFMHWFMQLEKEAINNKYGMWK